MCRLCQRGLQQPWVINERKKRITRRPCVRMPRPALGYAVATTAPPSCRCPLPAAATWPNAAAAESSGSPAPLVRVSTNSPRRAHHIWCCEHAVLVASVRVKALRQQTSRAQAPQVAALRQTSQTQVSCPKCLMIKENLTLPTFVQSTPHTSGSGAGDFQGASDCECGGRGADWRRAAGIGATAADVACTAAAVACHAASPTEAPRRRRVCRRGRPSAPLGRGAHEDVASA